MDLSTSYAGLTLRNPVIVAASSLTSNPENVVQCEKFGAAAVVLKSLYEEQIIADKGKLDTQDDMYHWYPDAADFIDKHAKEQGLSKYANLVRETKKAVSIPVIASINCASPGSWMEYISQVQEAGADALELNIFIPPTNPDIYGNDIEKQYVEIIESVIKKVQIPITVKIGFYFSNPANMIKQIDQLGVKGMVLFNRFFRPDVDIDTLRMKTTNVLSDPHEITMVLRWIALMSGKVNSDLCATTGIHDADSIIKHLLCGASTVQMASVLYQKGIEHIQEMLTGIENWMKDKKYENIAAFKGIMTDLDENKSAFERVHFIKKTLGSIV